MRKMLNIIAVLAILFLVAQFIYDSLIKEHKITYQLEVNGTEYFIEETFNNKHRSESYLPYDYNNYYFEISYRKKPLISFKIFDESYSKGLLHTFELYQDDDLVCVYPIFNNHKNQLNVICNKDGVQYDYLVLKGENDKLDKFVQALKTKGFQHYTWNDEPNKELVFEKARVFNDNLIKNQYIIVWHYKGFYLVSLNKQKKVMLLQQDRYDNNLGFLVNQYYVIPSYSATNAFSQLVRTNVTTLASHVIDLHYDISFNSFVQGMVDDKLYIIDKDNKRQYEINIDNKQIMLVGDAQNQARYYYNYQWDIKDIDHIIDHNLVFKEEQIIPDVLNTYGAFKIEGVMGETDGYYYLYVEEEGQVLVYRIDKQNIDVMTLLFKMPQVTNVKYIKDSIYFLNDNTLYMYQDSLGLRPLIKYDELRFNQRNMYDVYAR